MKRFEVYFSIIMILVGFNTWENKPPMWESTESWESIVIQPPMWEAQPPWWTSQPPRWENVVIQPPMWESQPPVWTAQPSV